jgi:hypothetical protein
MLGWRFVIILLVGFWRGFEFGASGHSMVIAAFGSLLGEAVLALNAYRQNGELPGYYS